MTPGDAGSMATIYGIRNCDTMKRALAWLAEHGVAHEFRDYKKGGVDPQLLARWSAQRWLAAKSQIRPDAARSKLKIQMCLLL